jgi:hypothetical protein
VDEGASVNEIARLLQSILTAMARETLVRLYPEAERVFESTPQSVGQAIGD